MINYSKVHKSLEKLYNTLPNQLKERPVQIREIVKKNKLDLEIKLVNLESRNAGFLYVPIEGVSIIGVNENDSGNRQNFTIAHELGHFLLHVPENRKTPNSFIDKDFIVLNRNQDSKLGINELEVEANYFAAELLMPAKDLYLDYVDQMKNNLNQDDLIESLANLYQVSKHAMYFRLSNLGFLI